MLISSNSLSLRTGTSLQGSFKTENALASGGLYYQTTKSLKVVFELNYATTKDKDSSAKKNSSFAPAVGMMLFF